MRTLDLGFGIGAASKTCKDSTKAKPASRAEKESCSCMMRNAQIEQARNVES